MPGRLILATANAHKVRELAAMLSNAGHERVVLSAADFGTPPEIPETAETFAGNAIQKVRGYVAWLAAVTEVSAEDLCVADDSGICIDALDGAPGVRSARFAGEDATDAANNVAMVSALRDRGLQESPAHYACVLAVARADGTPLLLEGQPPHEEGAGVLLFEGRCAGEVRVVSQGSGGFGYDPYFWVDDRTRTFADLSDAEKSARSHRGAAHRAMMARWQEFAV